MKNLKSLLLIFCLSLSFFASVAQEESELSPLTSDPLRYSNRPNLKNARVGNAPIFKDTLELPFFEDFTQASAPIDTVFQQAGNPYTVKTLGHHGLKNGNKLFLKVYAPNNVSLQGNYYAKVLNKSEFQLSTSANLANLLLANGVMLDEDFIVWNKAGAKLGPNPDSLKWEDDGGAYISDRISVQPPSLYVATFDALDANGKPYSNKSNSLNTDFLTSQPINLSGMTKDSNIVLSFYIEIATLGDTIGRFDSLYVLFKDKNNIWNPIWGKKKGAPFGWNKISIKITNSIYFHQAFQFKFQKFDAINGSVGHSVNIDYIYMDKNWNATKDFPIDAAINSRQTSILKKYAAMPYFQYTPDELADSVKFSLRNNADKVTSFGFVQNYINLDGTRSADNKVSVGFPNAQATVATGWAVDKSKVMVLPQKGTIKYEVNALTGDKVQPNRIRFTMNNRDSSSAILDNYYAYDDGSAETNFSIKDGSNGGRRLIKFKLNNVPDTLTHIDIFNPQTRFIVEDPNAILSRLIVADNNKNLIPASSTPIVFKYPNGREVFTRYKLINPYIITTNEFYVGWEQRNGSSAYYGYDLNSKSIMSVYRFPSGPWKDEEFRGTVMIRPVFRVPSATLGTEAAKENNLQCSMYPNPAKQQLTVEGDITHIEILYVTGQIAIQQKFANATDAKEVDLSTLPNGLYVVKMHNDHQQATKKLVIAR